MSFENCLLLHLGAVVFRVCVAARRSLRRLYLPHRTLTTYALRLANDMVASLVRPDRSTINLCGLNVANYVFRAHIVKSRTCFRTP